MVWTAPMTAITGSIFTASQYNTHIRDNMLETMPAKITADGDYAVVSGANSLSTRNIGSDSITTGTETTTSNSYTNLATVGPTVTLETGPTALVWWGAAMYFTTAGEFAIVGIEVSGATPTINATDEVSCHVGGISTGSGNINRWGSSYMFTGLTPGLNTFQCKYRGTGTSANITGYNDRELIVMPF